MRSLRTLLVLPLFTLALGATAQEKVLNLYSSRHYQTDEALYTGFTKATGIKVNRIEAGEDALIERIRNEGARSPADVLVTVDAGRLWRAEQLGLFQPVKSALLESRIPASFREPEGKWFGFSLRARVIAYNKAKVKPGELRNYEDLADATLAHGLTPLVVPQLRTITLGGAVTGLGIESASWRNGLPHESVLEMDVLTGAGEVVTASPTEHPDLFRGFANSYGTLGYATRLRIALEPVGRTVSLRHSR